MEASSHLPSLGFFGLLRNLRPATRTGPDLDGSYIKLVCDRCFDNDGVIRATYNSAILRRETDKTSMQSPLRK